MLDECGQGQQETKACKRAVENQVVVSQVRERDPPPPEIDPPSVSASSNRWEYANTAPSPAANRVWEAVMFWPMTTSRR